MGVDAADFDGDGWQDLFVAVPQRRPAAVERQR
ncbi:MAG TPA: FG-GAP repeat protein [Acidobacteriota bacterium]|nr:FG-GAP repeat protein [Acidobacteriota bacterium]